MPVTVKPWSKPQAMYSYGAPWLLHFVLVSSSKWRKTCTRKFLSPLCKMSECYILKTCFSFSVDRFKNEEGKNYFQLAPFGGLPLGAHFGAMGLGFCLSILFFVDQNVSAALVNAPHNK